MYEFGEVLPKRSNNQKKEKEALAPMFHDATWVGYNDKSNEHIVVVKGGPAVKVRTVRPRARGERWRAISTGHRGARHAQPEG